MKYFVELSDDVTTVTAGRVYPIFWDDFWDAMRVDFPSEYHTLGLLKNWEDDTGYVVEIP